MISKTMSLDEFLDTFFGNLSDPQVIDNIKKMVKAVTER
jgi:hypothetical protein